MDENQEEIKPGESMYDLPEVVESVLVDESDPSRQDEIDHAKLLEELQKQAQLQTRQMFHVGTGRISTKLRGVGITRKNKSTTKAKNRLARKMRRANHKHNSNGRN